MNKTAKEKTETKEITKIIKAPEFENILSQDHSFVYADNTQISLSLFDIKISFGVSQGRTPEGKVRIVNHTTLAMSPQHAKSVMFLLQQTLERYEREFMPLSLKETQAEFKED